MKKKYNLIVLMVLILIMASSCVTSRTGGDEPVTDNSPISFFPDENLEKVIRKTLNIPEGPLTENKLLRINKLDINDANIEDLEGIQYCKNVEELNMMNIDWKDNNFSNNNSIVSIEQLAAMSRLRDLRIGNTGTWDNTETKNIIYDLTPLKDLTRIEHLNVSDLNLYEEDLEVIANLFRLKYLFVEQNRISNIDFVAHKTDLIELSVNFSANLSDISALKGLTELKMLELGSCPKVKEISVVKNLINIERIYLMELDVDLSPVGTLRTLKDLLIFNSKVDDISFITSLTNLSILEAQGNNIQDLTPLMDLYNNGGFQGNSYWHSGPYIDIQNNSLDLRTGSRNREIIDELMSKGIEIKYQEGNILE